MPKLETYVVEERLRGSVTRSAAGASSGERALEGVVNTATAAAVSGARIVAAGVENAEKRRLK